MKCWWCWISGLMAVVIAAAAMAQDILPPGMDEPPPPTTGKAGAADEGVPERESNPISEVEFLRPHAAMMQERHAERMAEVSDAKVMRAIRVGADALLKRITDDCVGDPKAAAEKVLEVEKLVLEPAKEGALPMSVYALLVVGRAIDDDRLTPSSKAMARPIQLVMDLKSNYTYATAAQANALSLLPGKAELSTTLVAVRNRLLTNMHKDGAFGYTLPKVDFGGLGDDWRDNSNSQFALLGMWACDEAGTMVQDSFWKMSDQMWRARQMANGGWGYINYPAVPGKAYLASAETSQTMTAAGLASLYVTASRLNKQVQLNPKPDAAIESGLACLERNFVLMRTYMGTNPYFAYAVERMARASGRKYLGKLDWFREGAAEIIASQEKGMWRDVADAYPYAGTSFSLLFLARGSAPVAFNKLQYPGPWDARPQDVGNLTRWLEKKSERVLNWEIVDVDAKNDIDWADAPVLVITGHGDPKFTATQIEKLRGYVNAGGIIFSTADAGDNTFSELIKNKYAPMLSEQRYEMRVLPKTHPIYTLDIKAGSGRETPLWGMSNGAREIWIHSPKDMGAAWQSQAETQKEQWDLPANLLTYASGRVGLRRRLETLSVPDPAAAPTKKSAVARLKYSGNWDPEPGAWPRFARTAALQFDTKMDVRAVGLAELDAARMPEAHVTGTEAFTWSDAERAGLKKYLTAGGLIADAAGGSAEFSRSLQVELSKALPGVVLTPVDLAKDPVATGSVVGGTELKSLELRRFCLTPENVKKKMQMYEVMFDGRRVGFVFEGDVTSGLLGTNTWGVLGYSAATSEKLMWNALMLGKVR